MIRGRFVESVIKAPAAPEKRAGTKVSDEQILTGVTDRSRKVNAPEFLQPTGRFSSQDETVKAYRSARADTIALVKSTQEDLRARVARRTPSATPCRSRK